MNLTARALARRCSVLLALAVLTAFLLAPAITEGQGQTHLLKASPQTVHWGHFWAALKPVLTINSGDTVTIETVTGGPGNWPGVPLDKLPPELPQIWREVKDIGPGPHILTGPVSINGAEPGDVLEVRILDVQLRSPVAFNIIRPPLGVLPEEFPYYKAWILPIDLQKKTSEVLPGVVVPLRPFFGTMGVAPPPASGRISSGPPGLQTGNLDNKHLTAGTTLYMPVHVRGALFSAGDGHAAQGNGEVNLTAIETNMTGTFQIVVRKGKRLRWPRAETPTHYITMGLDVDLNKAAEIAVRETILFLQEEKGLSREDAYMLTSVAIDLEVTQLVDGVKGVHAMIPKAIFTRR
ncbi:MAG: acetamidase/formamidase family protein [Deltaproteobacteria bacterium]|nr:acetamidase/formamidase family protein [Deltaproteobacteria bacterium]